MNLDIKERLFLSFQLKILEKLYPEEKEYYANHRKAIEDGYELHYSWITEHLSEGLTSEKCKLVLDILDMYSVIFRSFKGLENPTKLTKKDIIFQGFDGNKETMFMAYTKYFIEDLDRFEEIRKTTKGYYNSHFPMIPKYEKMLIKYKDYVKGYNYNLSEEQIFDLVKTPIY